METTNIISIMIGQHRTLQKDLGNVAGLLNNEIANTQAIDNLLKQFAKDLTEHLHLENDVFYVDLLKKMKDKGQDTAKTEQFIAEMDNIGNAVISFLGKYKDAKTIEQKIEEFKPEFKNIVNTLNLRIESEESGVYAYWGLF